MKNFKRILSAFLAVLMLAVFTGCGLSENDLGGLISDVIGALDTADLPSGDTDAPVTVEVVNPADTPQIADETKSPAPDTEKPSDTTTAQNPSDTTAPQTDSIDENGWYTAKDDVALYIHTFGHLPGNFITKKQAEALGWTGGGLDKFANGKSIGGDRFGNYEGALPKEKERTYTECDIDTMHKNSRGAKRIVFSNDGLIYYTDDHYETFTLLYGGK